MTTFISVIILSREHFLFLLVICLILTSYLFTTPEPRLNKETFPFLVIVHAEHALIKPGDQHIPWLSFDIFSSIYSASISSISACTSFMASSAVFSPPITDSTAIPSLSPISLHLGNLGL